MTHSMKLSQSAYFAFKNGGKRVEMRLWDEKRRAITPGDEIVFECPTCGRIKVTVENVKVFKNFSALYAYYPAEKLGYAKGECPCPDDMNAYYTVSQQQKYGVVAIETSAPQEV